MGLKISFVVDKVAFDITFFTFVLSGIISFIFFVLSSFYNNYFYDMALFFTFGLSVGLYFYNSVLEIFSDED